MKQKELNIFKYVIEMNSHHAVKTIINMFLLTRLMIYLISLKQITIYSHDVL